MDVQLYMFINGAWQEYNPKPAAHSHAWSEITGKPTTFNPVSHGHAWGEITGKPTTFTPSSHGHAWGEITGKPTTFTPSSHSHGKSQITNFDNEVLALFPAWAKKTSLAIGDIPTGTTGSTVAFGNHTHSVATISVAGLMSGADKTKLNSIATGAQKNSAITKAEIETSLGYTPENAANKITSIRTTATDTAYVTELGVKTYVDGLIGSVYRPAGDWNANTNAPALANNILANAGKVYRVSVAGTRFGFTFAVGDKLAFNESGVISKWDNIDDVVSVNGQTGTVVLTTDNVSDATQTNKFVNVAQTTWIESLRTRLTYNAGAIMSSDVFEAPTVTATTRLISSEFRLPAPTQSAQNWRIYRATDYLEIQTNANKMSIGGTANDASYLKGDWQMDAGYTPNNIRSIVNKGFLDTQLSGKVDKDGSKVLSTNDYTDTEKNKLAGIDSGAQVNVGTNLSQGARGTTTLRIDSSTGNNLTLPAVTTSLAGLMTSADKSKLNGIASGAEVNVQADWNETSSSSDAFIQNKPSFTNWTQVWSGAINLNSYRSSYYHATVPSDSYIGKRIAIQIQADSGNSYTSTIIFGVLGLSSTTAPSSSSSIGIGWSNFDGTYLRTNTLYTNASTTYPARISVGYLKTLFGTFSGTTIDWVTTKSETLYMRKIWVIE